MEEPLQSMQAETVFQHAFTKKLSNTSLILALLLALPILGISQKLFISGTLLDQSTSQPIPFANIYNKHNGQGTLSNLDGYFVLGNVKATDTIVLSFIGYEKLILIPSESIIDTTLMMVAKHERLKEVTVMADDSYLYEMVAKCKKNIKPATRTAKTYYLLQSSENGRQIESVESYYNGEFSGYDVNELHLKNGRVALKKINNRFFLSTESSKAIYMHKLLNHNPYFPTSPFELSKRKLKKEYDLFLESKYLSDDSATMYVIEFVPKDSTSNFFHGKMWLDSISSTIFKTNLQIVNATKHPFLPAGFADSIEQVDLNLTKNYEVVNNELRFTSVDFKYDVVYRTLQNTRLSVNTNAVLYAYDYETPFILPQFEFTEGTYGDYRKIQAVPYNDFFWENINEFKMNELTSKNEQFVKSKSTLRGDDLFTENQYFKNGFFETPYMFWKKARVVFREDSINALGNNPAMRSSIPADRYHLEVQIYMDINELNDSLHFTTKTVFDPFKSFYHLPLDQEGIAFINMYFDLAEIKRRELEEELRKQKDMQSMTTIYETKMQQLKMQSQAFLKDTDHGTNRSGMEKWNTYIAVKLQIDNIKLYRLYTEQ